jgi:serine/threonine-protein kinase
MTDDSARRAMTPVGRFTSSAVRALPLAVLIALFATTARAQTSGADRAAAAEALFDEGRKLMQDGSYAQACVKFAESQRLDAGVGTWIYLADCYEKAGRLASSWVTFREAAAAARAAGQAEREKLARDRASQLEPKLTKLVLGVLAGEVAER